MSTTRDPYPDRPVKPRPGTGNNLPGAKARKPQWNHPVMMAAKVVAYCFAVDHAGSHDRLIRNRKWAKLGIRRSAMLSHVRSIVGGFDARWDEEKRRPGDAAKAQALMNRVWYMCTERDEDQVPHGVASRENPLVSQKVGRFYEPARKINAAGALVSRKQIERLFSRE